MLPLARAVGRCDDEVLPGDEAVWDYYLEVYDPDFLGGKRRTKQGFTILENQEDEVAADVAQEGSSMTVAHAKDARCWSALRPSSRTGDHRRDDSFVSISDVVGVDAGPTGTAGVKFYDIWGVSRSLRWRPSKRETEGKPRVNLVTLREIPSTR